MDPTLTPEDENQLQMLATAFRVVGGLCAFCVNIAWIHVIVGLAAMLTGGAMSTDSPASKKDVAGGIFGFAFGSVFSCVGLMIILAGYAMGYYAFRAAKSMEQRRNWNLCFGVSIAFMLFQPIGLVLGILALIVLNRSTVKPAFTS